MPDAVYTAFVYRIWDRLELLTGRPPHYIAADRIASYCPICRDGALGIKFLDTPRGPRARLRSSAGTGQCSEGCTSEEIMQALS